MGRTGRTTLAAATVAAAGGRLTFGGGRAVGAREDGLGDARLTVEALQDSAELVAQLGVVVDLCLEILEDAGVNSGAGRVRRRHGDGVERGNG